jgi:hypothetical protein
MGDRRCCPERQTLLCSVCRHTLARGFGPGVGKALDVMSRERQTRSTTESPSLVLIINDTKLLMTCVKCFELGISNTCDEGVYGKE